ncbi:MAG: cobalamin biosynthesis protein CobQ, partial [Clostridia bacterium]|nr:cobalamin biosynthesis protein CobQ [Clostridia bacterium]
MDNTQLRNLSIVAGHYGAGKTNFAVNLAIWAKTVFPGHPVHAADLDIVNPYFRTADAASLLREHGIDPLIPEFANTNVDIPSLPPRMRGLIGSKDDVTIIDVGGDDGSVALGMYREAILEAGYSLFYVVNRFRPLISDPEDAVGCMIEIENACGLRCTAL